MKPSQLTVYEVGKIARAFTMKKFQSLSSYAISTFLLKKEIVVASNQTIQNYARAMGLTMRNIQKKKIKRGCIKATKVNEIWHVDVTNVESKEGKRFRLHLYMDNFSRKILEWRLEFDLRAQTTTDMLRKALADADLPFQDLPDVVSDGGKENDNTMVRELLGEKGVKLLIAQKDIHASNSMIEAVNKTLKYRHIFIRPVAKTKELRKGISRAIREYNNRYHSSLKGLTPNEVYSGKRFDKSNHQRILEEAQKRRKEINKKSCPPCIPQDFDVQKFPQLAKLVVRADNER